MKFLIAGLGSIGRRHLRNLIALGEKDIIFYRTHKSTMSDNELSGFPIETDLTRALAHKPDAVIISNPTALHLDIAIPAAKIGATILLEKPISHSMVRVNKLQEIVQKSGSKVLVAFQFRYHPGLVRAKQLIADGKIGRVISAHVHFGEYLPSWHPWEDYRKSYAARADMGGGVVLTQCHSLDYLPWLVGKRVEKVWSFTGNISDLDVNVEDTAKIGLLFAGDALGSLHLDYNRQPPVHTFDIVGTKGSIKWNLIDGNTHIYRVKEKEWKKFTMPNDWERNVMFMEQMKHFLAVVYDQADPTCTLNDGVRVQLLVEAVHNSQKTGQSINL